MTGILRSLFERVSYRSTSALCGSCGELLDFRDRRWPLPGAWYVHSATRQRRCADGYGEALPWSTA